jgi:hypothetical protein
MKPFPIWRTVLNFRVALVVGSSTLVLATTAAASSSAGTIQGRIKSWSPDASVVKMERIPDSTVYQLPIDDADAILLKTTATDTIVQVEVDDTVRPTKITRVDKISVPVGAYPRIIAIGGSFIVLLLFATLATRGRPLRFLVGLDNRYSNSQCQIVLWFGALAVIYVSAVILRIVYLNWNFIGGVGVTANVIALTGLSAVSFGGAKVITSQKTSPGAQSGVPQNIPGQLLRPQKVPAPSPNLLTDLFLNDRGDADFGDFQMILVALAAVAIFMASCFAFLGNLWPDQSIVLPDIDTTLLSAFGVGQGAYLLKKAAMKPGEG